MKQFPRAMTGQMSFVLRAASVDQLHTGKAPAQTASSPLSNPSPQQIAKDLLLSSLETPAEGHPVDLPKGR